MQWNIFFNHGMEKRGRKQLENSADAKNLGGFVESQSSTVAPPREQRSPQGSPVAHRLPPPSQTTAPSLSAITLNREHVVILGTSQAAES